MQNRSKLGMPDFTKDNNQLGPTESGSGKAK